MHAPRAAVLVGILALVTITAHSAKGAAAPSAVPALLPDVPVTAVDLANQRAQNSPALAVDPTDSRFVALASRVDAPEFDCALHVSGDAGRSWRPAHPVRQLPPGAERCYGPEVAFDGDGTLYYLFVGLHTKGNTPMGVFITASHDRTAFTPPRQILGPDRFQVRMAIDPTVGDQGRIHLVWLEARSPPHLGGLPVGPNPLMHAYSDDGARTFSEPVQVSDAARHLVVAPAVVLGPTGQVHVAYYDLEDDVRDYQGLEGPTWEGTWSLVVSSSADGGRSFTGHTVAAAALVPPQRVMLIFTMPPPSLVAGPGGELWLSWWDARNHDWDVFLTSSTDAGRSWTEPLRLNDDPNGEGGHQYLPRLSLAPNGRVDVIFYDRRDDPTNRNNHVYYTFSNDGGRHFAPNRRLTAEPSHSLTGARYIVPSAAGLVEFGSRLALVSDRVTALAAWTDTRNVRWESTHQDVFATRVDFPPREKSSAGVSPADVVSGAAGLAVASAALCVAFRSRRRRRTNISANEAG